MIQYPYCYSGCHRSGDRVASAGVVSLDLFFFCFIWGSGVCIENEGFFSSGQILEMYVVSGFF